MMADSPHEIEWAQAEPPLPANLAEELLAFWEATFSVRYGPMRDLLADAERSHGRNIFYIARSGERLAGTAHLALSAATPELGGLGDVATAKAFRGRGIAARLAARARDDFLNRRGRALFLGTVNPVAERIYRRLGWRKLEATSVMCLVGGNGDPHEFLTAYYERAGKPRVSIGSAAHRLGVIPLIVSRHDWLVLDANLDLYSTRAAVQDSCMSLYPRYNCLREDGGGEWFAACDEHGRVVGLATALRRRAGLVLVDGFAHRQFTDVLAELVRSATIWGRRQGAVSAQAVVADHDVEKRRLFGSLGFVEVGSGERLHPGQQTLKAVRLEKEITG